MTFQLAPADEERRENKTANDTNKQRREMFMEHKPPGQSSIRKTRRANAALWIVITAKAGIQN